MRWVGLGMGRGRARRGGGEHLWFAGVHLRALPLVHDVGGTLRTTPLEVLVVGRRSETVGLRALIAAGKVRARARTGRWSGKLTCSPTVEQRKKLKCITNVMYQMYCCSAGCRAKGACFESRGSPVSTSCSNSSLKMVAWNFGRAAQQASASKSDSTCGGDSNARECRLPRGAGSVEGVFARACWRRSPCHAKVVAWDAVLCDKGPGANSTPAMKAVPGGQRGRGEERGRCAGGIQMQGNVTPVTMLYTREFSGS